MSSRILPALGSSGTYELLAPFDTKVYNTKNKYIKALTHYGRIL